MAEDIPQVTQAENEALVAEFSEKEVRDAIFQMKHNRTPVFQVFWSLIKDDLMDMFRDFHNGSLPLFCLNFGIITLLPKEQEAKKIQQYWPICMLNVCFKIFTKVIANRLSSVASKVIRPSQSAFLPGRNILEGVVVLHETVHELLDWDFLQQVLMMKGFFAKWCQWIEKIVEAT
jgi:hypothetical protein